MQKQATETPRRGRPTVETKKVKLSASVSPEMIAAIMREANKRDETVSAYVARAIQNQLNSDQ